MAKPALGSVAQDLYDKLVPLAYDDARWDWPLAKFCAALGSMYQIVDLYGRDDPDTGAPGWSIAIDLSRCPDSALPWLGQFVGVRLPQGLTADQARAYIADAPGWDRGTYSAFVGAVAPYLVGNKTLIVRERFNQANPGVDSPGYVQVITYTADTPDQNVALAAMMAQKPAGIVLNYVVQPGQNYQQVYDNNATYQILYNKYTTYQKMLDDTPG